MGNKVGIISWPSSPRDEEIKNSFRELAKFYNLAIVSQVDVERGWTFFAVEISGFNTMMQTELLIDDFLTEAKSYLERHHRLEGRTRREFLPM